MSYLNAVGRCFSAQNIATAAVFYILASQYASLNGVGRLFNALAVCAKNGPYKETPPSASISNNNSEASSGTPKELSPSSELVKGEVLALINAFILAAAANSTASSFNVQPSAYLGRWGFTLAAAVGSGAVVYSCTPTASLKERITTFATWFLGVATSAAAYTRYVTNRV